MQKLVWGIALLFSISLSSFGCKENEKKKYQDALDEVESSSPLIEELKNVYRAFHINNIISDELEWIYSMLEQDAKVNLTKELNQFKRTCDSLKVYTFKDDTLQQQVHGYLQKTIELYQVAIENGFASPSYDSAFQVHDTTYKEFFLYLNRTYSTAHFINLTEEEYWKRKEKSQYMESKEFAALMSNTIDKPQQVVNKMETIANSTKDFLEQSIYRIEVADKYVIVLDSLEDNAYQKAIKIYKQILDDKIYCHYLFEAWLKWRTISQIQNHGISKFSIIPNDEYDSVRLQAAITILKHIAKNEKDEMAINEFLLFSTHEIIKRYGEYPYGNNAGMDFYEIYVDK
jgi:hypothetical protein